MEAIIPSLRKKYFFLGKQKILIYSNKSHKAMAMTSSQGILLKNKSQEH